MPGGEPSLSGGSGSLAAALCAEQGKPGPGFGAPPDPPTCWAWRQQGPRGVPAGGGPGGTGWEAGAGGCKALLLAAASGAVHRILVRLREDGGAASLELQVRRRVMREGT